MPPVEWVVLLLLGLFGVSQIYFLFRVLSEQGFLWALAVFFFFPLVGLWVIISTWPDYKGLLLFQLALLVAMLGAGALLPSS